MVGLQGCSAGPSVGLEVRGRLWPDPFTAPPGPCAGFGWPNPFAVPPLYQPFGPANFFPNPLKGKGLAVNPGEPRTFGSAVIREGNFGFQSASGGYRGAQP